MNSVRDTLRAAVERARTNAVVSGTLPVSQTPLPPVSIQRPARAEHGDYATNAAMQLAPTARMPPMRIAEALVAELKLPEAMGSAEVAPPGFINIRLEAGWVASQVGAMLSAGAGYGRVPVGRPRSVNVEFVSANPTGPLTLGNARGAFVGDLLCRVLEAVGHRVTREYYFNDFNAQVRNLGLSVQARRTGGPIPEDGYHGEYVAELAARLPDDVWAAATTNGADAGEVLGRWASERVRAGIEESLDRLGVHFDVWTTEGSLYGDGWVERAVGELRKAGHVYEQDGAVWFRSTAFGDDKDRVVYRSNGQPTYFASDIGYLAQKFSRGFDELIYLWGEDHHGTVARNRAAARALGLDPESVHWLLMAWVRFVRDGTEIGMSKRAGEFVTLDELLAEIGPDAARWFFGSRATTTGIDFDIELAKRQGNENPVYYVQYAHARCCSILRNARERGVKASTADAAALLRHPAEQALIRELLRLPEVVSDAAARRETHEVPKYCLEVAGLFSQFYRDCRVLTDDPEEARFSGARLALVDAVRLVVANTLGTLGIAAPEMM
ncbi:MAG: arginine--tRNA ligase [Chloroflexi bacterium]|nr:MAG: arginine--tRNA ligase [Chloroflexota bacterium]